MCECVCQLMSFVLWLLFTGPHFGNTCAAKKTVPESPRRGIRCNLVGMVPTRFMLILARGSTYINLKTAWKCFEEGGQHSPTKSLPLRNV